MARPPRSRAAPALQELCDRAALDVLHDDEVAALVDAGVVDLDDVGVDQLRHRERLAAEAGDELLVVGEVLGEDLDRRPCARGPGRSPCRRSTCRRSRGGRPARSGPRSAGPAISRRSRSSPLESARAAAGVAAAVGRRPSVCPGVSSRRTAAALVGVGGGLVLVGRRGLGRGLLGGGRRPWSPRCGSPRPPCRRSRRSRSGRGSVEVDEIAVAPRARSSRLSTSDLGRPVDPSTKLAAIACASLQFPSDRPAIRSGRAGHQRGRRRPAGAAPSSATAAARAQTQAERRLAAIWARSPDARV